VAAALGRRRQASTRASHVQGRCAARGRARRGAGGEEQGGAGPAVRAAARATEQRERSGEERKRKVGADRFKQFIFGGMGRGRRKLHNFRRLRQEPPKIT
jgi:hypothetical protein